MFIFIIGTRPEAIKMAPVIKEFYANGQSIHIIFTRQHSHVGFEFLCDILGEEYDNWKYEIPQGVSYCEAAKGRVSSSQETLAISVAEIQTFIANELGVIIKECGKKKVHTVFVQGDTTSAVAGALAAFYMGIPVAHIEAGLRTWDLASPFPEEANRQIISRIASINLCPTEKDKYNLNVDGVSPSKCFVVGNTVIDALVQTMPKNSVYRGQQGRIYITLHRRETRDFREAMIYMLFRIAEYVPYLEFVFLKRENDEIDESLFEEGCPFNFMFHPAVSYQEMAREIFPTARLFITDSGGLQEECTFLGIKCLVLREKSERVDTSTSPAFRAVEVVPLSKGSDFVNKRICREIKINPTGRVFIGDTAFGTGNAAQKIYDVLRQHDVLRPQEKKVL